MSLTVSNVSKRFGNLQALDNVSLEVKSGVLMALLGPSGCGKTTLLRVMAGLETADQGTVHYHDEDVTRRRAKDRNVGFVFQHYALFRHMSVFENIAFGLRVRRVADAKVRERVGELLHLIRLEGYEKRFPSQLSGGQRQRVALARALAAEPRVLLLDEPFGALDAKVRVELRQWLRRLHDEMHITSIFVTHDQEEAFEVADHVVVMNRGRIEQGGSPLEVFQHPANPFVMDFLGNVNVFHCRVQGGKALLGNLEIACPDQGSGEARVYVRPHELEIDRVLGSEPGIEARILHVNPAGPVTKLRLSTSGSDLALNADISPERFEALALKTGDTVYVSPRRARVFAPEYVI